MYQRLPYPITVHISHIIAIITKYSFNKLNSFILNKIINKIITIIPISRSQRDII